MSPVRSRILAALLACGLAAPAQAVKFRRPFNPAIKLGHGFDHNFSAAGCSDWNCGGTCYNTHSGSDFPMGVGNDVLAGAPGTVVQLNQGCADTGYYGNPCGGKCGNYVRIQHADGSRSLYCHMKNGSLTVSLNQKVSCGQKIGQSASSGSSTGPHLHFGWQPTGGSSADPFKGNCSSGNAWVDQGAYPGLPSTACEIQCACSPGATQSDGCGQCGTRTRTCGSNCQWGGWGSCGSQGPCAPGQGQSEGCGSCGTRSRTCTASCQWGGWGSCGGQGPCAPGSDQSEGCGNCGTRARSCTSACQWGGWGACAGEGPCAPGQAESEACCDCGERSRTCTAACPWAGWGGCAGPDPPGAPTCDTGKLGDCAAGVVRCTAGCLTCTDTVAPSPEQCDGRDNDCDGPVDEEATELGASPPIWAAELVDLSAPTSLRPGEPGQVWAEFRNVGTGTWPAGATWLGALGPDGALSPLWDASGWSAWDVAAAVGAEVAPGQTVRFAFPVRLDPDAGPNTGDSATRFAVIVAGEPMMCPQPGFDVSVLSLAAAPDAGPGPAAWQPDRGAATEDGPGAPRPIQTDPPAGAGAGSRPGAAGAAVVGGSVSEGCTVGAPGAGGFGAGPLLLLAFAVLVHRRRRVRPAGSTP